MHFSVSATIYFQDRERKTSRRGVPFIHGERAGDMSAVRGAGVAKRVAWLGILGLLACGAAAFAQMSESFEYGVPPPGWIKTNLLGGGGWYQLPIGTMPLPGWGNGTSSVPATAPACSKCRAL